MERLMSETKSGTRWLNADAWAVLLALGLAVLVKAGVVKTVFW